MYKSKDLNHGTMTNERVNKRRRFVLLSGLAAGAASMLQACGGGSSTNAAADTSEVNGLQCTKLQALSGVNTSTLAPIPGNAVSLSTYGGVPGASSTTNQTAFANALNALKASGGGTLNINPGTYQWGSSGSDMSFISGLNNVHINAPGVTIQCNSNGANPSIWSFWNCSNIGITGVTFNDLGANPLNMQGAYALLWEGDRPTSKFKTTNVTVTRGLMAFRCFGGDLQTEIDMQITVNDCYYGPNTGTNGNGASSTTRSRFDITGTKTRRIFLAFGAKHMDVKINYTGSSSDIGSNGLIDIVAGSNDPWAGDLNVDDCTFDCTVSGYLGNHQCIFQHYLQGPNNTAWYYRNLKVNVNCVNVSGGTHIHKFVHDNGTAELGTTLRTFANIELTGTVSGTYQATMIDSTTTSSSSGNSVRVASTLAPYVNMAALPRYFLVFAPAGAQCG
jgi:hypothetical protein